MPGTRTQNQAKIADDSAGGNGGLWQRSLLGLDGEVEPVLLRPVSWPVVTCVAGNEERGDRERERTGERRRGEERK